jgi:hypothetical protein
MKDKFQLQFMELDKKEWRTISRHASITAAYRRLKKETAHLTPGTWDGYYRVIAPDGSALRRDEIHFEANLETAQREMKRRRGR